MRGRSVRPGGVDPVSDRSAATTARCSSSTSGGCRPRRSWLRCETPEEVAEAIRTLAVRGAPAIGLAAAYGLALADGRPCEAAAADACCARRAGRRR